MYKAIIFDFDGTLADTMELVKKAFNKLAPEFNYKIVEEDAIKTLRNYGAREFLKYLRIGPQELPVVVKKVKEEMTKEISNVRTFDGLKEVLEDIKNTNIKLGILTSNTIENVKAFLSHNDMNFFDFIDSEDDLFGKAAALKKLCESHEFGTNDIIYVGDEIRDIDACKEAKVDMIAVGWGYNSFEALEKNDPNYVAKTPSDLKQILR